MRLALYQPDIAANTGTMLRLAACMGVAADIIEPCGFPFSAAAFRRAAMDYPAHAVIEHHLSWAQFLSQVRGQIRGPRIILLSTKAAQRYTDYQYRSDDILMVGQEGSGVPEEVGGAVDGSVLIPMAPGLRSLNVALAAAMVMGEALRQTKW
jgi:tRNA (cytidine/uridine-2'-O-)-methyltransferase